MAPSPGWSRPKSVAGRGQIYPQQRLSALNRRTAWLLCTLSFIAGILSVDPVAFPRNDVLGIHPSLQTLLAQAAVIVLIVIAYVVNTRTRPRLFAGSSGV